MCMAHLSSKPCTNFYCPIRGTVKAQERVEEGEDEEQGEGRGRKGEKNVQQNSVWLSWLIAATLAS